MRKLLIATTAIAAMALTACGDAESTDAGSSDAWNTGEKYETYCAGDVNIAPELADVVAGIEIPEGGHIQNARFNTNTDDPSMHDIGFDICAPLAGDNLRHVAEEIAIAVRASEHGPTIAQMGVKALPDDTTAETILRDEDFQLHLHDGGEAFDNGAYRAAWEAKN